MGSIIRLLTAVSWTSINVWIRNNCNLLSKQNPLKNNIVALVEDLLKKNTCTNEIKCENISLLDESTFVANETAD